MEALVKHLHSFVKIKNSSDKIYVSFYVDVNVNGTLTAVNHFDVSGAIGLSTKERELKKLVSTAGSDAAKLRDTKTIEAFYDYFAEHKIQHMDRATFVRILTTSPLLNYEHNVADSAFTTFDANRDGSLSLREIAIGFCQLSSADDEVRLKILFDIYDVDKSGTLDIEELTDMIVKATGKSVPDAHTMASAAVVKNGGELTLDAFTQQARSRVIDLGLSFTAAKSPHTFVKSQKKEGQGQRSFGNSEKQEGPVKKSNQFCNFVFTAASCKKGNACRFRHDKEKATEADKQWAREKLGDRFVEK